MTNGGQDLADALTQNSRDRGTIAMDESKSQIESRLRAEYDAYYRYAGHPAEQAKIREKIVKLEKQLDGMTMSSDAKKRYVVSYSAMHPGSREAIRADYMTVHADSPEEAERKVKESLHQTGHNEIKIKGAREDA